jgi:molybdate transport system ATP-binding protein
VTLARQAAGEGALARLDRAIKTVLATRGLDPPPEAGGSKDAVLEVDIELPLGAFTLAARFASDAGVTALFGRSGAGKTTIIDCIAGLRRPARGRIAVAGETLFDSAAGVDAPRHRRRVGYVFQDARLFPHLTVRRNLLYGRWFRRGAGGPALDEVVDLLGVRHLLDRRPGALSGGERQRVAVGRALLAAPRLLLMDEPLASLDERRKDEILPYLDRLRREGRVPIVYVSHSLDEVARLAESVVLLSEGRVAAAGPVAEVLGRLDLRPATGRAEAGAILDGVVTSHDAAYELTAVEVAGQPVLVPRLEAAPGERVRLRVRARDVALALAPQGGTSVRNQLRGRVAAIEREAGAFAEASVDLGGGQLLRARLTRLSADELGLAPGAEVVALLRVAAVERRLVLPADRQG